MKRMLIIVGLLSLLSACGAGPKAIVEGTLRDTLFAVEPRANNTISVWMTHDDVGVYCTTDTELGDKALSFLRSTNPTVIITYRSVNNDDPEWAWLGDLTGGGCASERGDNVEVYKLLTIEQAEQSALTE
jgi:hypothetical protein